MLAAAIALLLCQCSWSTTQSAPSPGKVNLTGPKVGLTSVNFADTQARRGVEAGHG